MKKTTLILVLMVLVVGSISQALIEKSPFWNLIGELLVYTGNVKIDGNLTVTGSFIDVVDYNVTGNMDVGGDLRVVDNIFATNIYQDGNKVLDTTSKVGNTSSEIFNVVDNGTFAYNYNVDDNYTLLHTEITNANTSAINWIYSWVYGLGYYFSGDNISTFITSNITNHEETYKHGNTTAEIWIVVNNGTFVEIVNTSWITENQLVNTSEDIWTVVNNETFVTFLNDSWVIKLLNSTADIWAIVNNGSFVEIVNTSWKVTNATHSDSTSATLCDDGEYLDGQDGLCINLNDTIVARLVTTYFNATSISVVTGTEEGVIGDLLEYDSGGYNVSEVNSDFDLRVNFTGVTGINQLVYRYKSDEDEPHIMHTQLWDYVLGDWEEYAEEGARDHFGIFTYGVYDESDHLSDGVVQLRFYTTNPPPNTVHKWQFDWITVSDGLATPSSSESDPFSVHRDGTTPLFANWNQGAFNLTNTLGWFLGWTNASKVFGLGTKINTALDNASIIRDYNVSDWLVDGLDNLTIFRTYNLGTYANISDIPIEMDNASIIRDYNVSDWLVDSIDNRTIIRYYNVSDWLVNSLDNSTISRTYEKHGNTTDEIWGVVDNNTYVEFINTSWVVKLLNSTADIQAVIDSNTLGNTTEEIIKSATGKVNSTSWDRTGTDVILANIGDNVGIGTTTPGTNVQVSGGTDARTYSSSSSSTAAPWAIDNGTTVSIKSDKASVDNSAAYLGLASKTSGSQTTISYIGNIAGTGTASDMVGNAMVFGFRTDGATNYDERMRLTNEGNVGIGTTTPSEKLEVIGNFSVTGEYAGGTADVAQDMANYYDVNGVLRSSLDVGGRQTWYVSTTAAEAGRIVYATPGGQPGIVFFDEDGTDRSDFALIAGGGFSWGASTASTLPPTLMTLKTGGDLAVDTKTLYVDASENSVGIGTTTPTAKLDVAGTINATAMKTVTLNVTGTSYLTEINGTAVALDVGWGNITGIPILGNTTQAIWTVINNNTYVEFQNISWVINLLNTTADIQAVINSNKLGNTTVEIWNVVDNNTFAQHLDVENNFTILNTNIANANASINSFIWAQGFYMNGDNVSAFIINNITTMMENSTIIRAYNVSDWLVAGLDNLTIFRDYNLGNYANMSDLIGNETTRFDTLAGTDCGGTDKMTGVGADGTPACDTDTDTTYTLLSEFTDDITDNVSIIRDHNVSDWLVDSLDNLTIFRSYNLGDYANKSNLINNCSEIDSCPDVYYYGGLSAENITTGTLATARLSTATPENGVTTSVSTADQIYDYIVSLSYVANAWVADGDIGADEISESKINFVTACAAGKYYRLTGNDLECTTPTDTTYSAGNGISLSTTTFSVAAGAGLDQEASGLKVEPDGITDTELAFNTGQHLTKTSSPQFANLNTTGTLNITSADGSGTGTIYHNGSHLILEG